MADPFREARLKIKRANQHIADLKRTISALKESSSSTVLVNADTGNQELVHLLDFGKYADDIALVAGDAIHNLRSALDFAWVALLGKHIHTFDRDHAKFPVHATLKDLKGSINGIGINPFSNTAIFNLLVTDIQPYKTGKYSAIFYTLHKLDITDKHLVLLALSPVAGINGIVVQDNSGETFQGFGAPTSAGPPYVISFAANIQIKNEGKLAFDIVMPDTGLYSCVEITEVLSKFSEATSYVVQLMENL